MSTKYFLLPAILGLAGLLFAPNMALAQKGGGGRGGGGGGGARGGASIGGAARGGASMGGARPMSAPHIGGAAMPAHAGNFHPGATQGGTFNHTGNMAHNANFNHNGVYYHNGNYYRHGYNFGSFYPGFFFGIGLYAPFYPSAYAWDYDVAPRFSYYPADVLQQPVPAAPYAQETPKDAQIVVLLPDLNAKVWFDGSPTTSTGAERAYYTPELKPGVTSSYRVRATWEANGKEITQERVVGVAPGRGSVVDFTRPAAEGVPAPKQ